MRSTSCAQARRSWASARCCTFRRRVTMPTQSAAPTSKASTTSTTSRRWSSAWTAWASPPRRRTRSSKSRQRCCTSATWRSRHATTARMAARSVTQKWPDASARCCTSTARTSQRFSSTRPWRTRSPRRSSTCRKRRVVPPTRGTRWRRPCTRGCSIGWSGASIRAPWPSTPLRSATRLAFSTSMASRSSSGILSSSSASTSPTRSCSSTLTRTCLRWNSSCTPKRASVGRTSPSRTTGRSSTPWSGSRLACSASWTPSASCRTLPTRPA
mmetsp:Transcript_118604/g.343004  ORF Transcript_118604/g.343004 Transcript_118604/m.343004 type:complete len:270 (+) Transcript_118604:415-1224(+)